MTDTASYTDVIFGLFHVLGYQFSPRLADVGEARFWRIDASADYGVLNGLARQTINRSPIQENWDDVLRVAGSLKLGTVNVTELLRALQGGGRLSTLAKAITELGRIAKTFYLSVTWNTTHQQEKTGMFFSVFHWRKKNAPRERSRVKAA